MSNLLAIESAFLSLPQVKQALNLTEINRVQRSITNAKKQKFAQTLNLSKLAVSVVAWFASPAGQELTAEEGITWSNEEIGQKVFGWQKSYFYKVLKAGKLQEAVVTEFTAQCDTAESEGLDPDRSLAGLLKFAKSLQSSNAGGSEGEGGGKGGETETAVAIRPETIFTLSYKHESGTIISIKVNSNGEAKTENSRAELNQAIWFLSRITGELNYESN
jgi:hypothetical protein